MLRFSSACHCQEEEKAFRKHCRRCYPQFCSQLKLEAVAQQVSFLWHRKPKTRTSPLAWTALWMCNASSVDNQYIQTARLCLGNVSRLWRFSWKRFSQGLWGTLCVWTTWKLESGRSRVARCMWHEHNERICSRDLKLSHGLHSAVTQMRCPIWGWIFLKWNWQLSRQILIR